jgi:hypothetical protein
MKNLKSFNFDFDTNGMSDYLNANADLLLHKIIMDTTEAQYYRVLPNIKYGELIPVFETGAIDNIAFPGNSCSFSGGNITLSEVELKVCQYNIQKNWCIDELNRTIMSIRLGQGSYLESVGASTEEAFMNDISKKANVYASRKFWGATTATDGCSGIKEQLESAAISGSVVNIAYTAMTPSNAIAVSDAYITNLPDALKPITTIMALSHSDFQALQLALRNQNLYNFNPITLANGQMAIQIPFTNVIAISTEIAALGGNAMVLTNPENLMYGTDLLSDITSPIAWYSLDFQEQRLKLAMKLGSAVAFGSQVVYAS